MKHRFLNQKLGKRMSRKAELQKAKVLATKSSLSHRAGQVPRGPAPAEKAR